MNPLFTATFRAMLRRRGMALLLFLTVTLGVATAMILQGLAARQEAELARTEAETVISCYVTDVNGGGRDSLMLSNVVLETLMGTRDPHNANLAELVENVRAMSVLSATVPDGVKIVYTTALAADPALTAAEGGSAVFYDGWDESVLLTDRRVCLVPEGMSTEFTDDGIETLRLVTELFDVRLQVIGTHTGSPQWVYVPFNIQWSDETTVARHADSCSFDLRDNSRLAEAKARLYAFEYFVEPSVHNEREGLEYGLIVQDETYLAAVAQIEENLRTLHILMPFLLGPFCLAGFFISALSARGRMREFAVMRCLGMKRRRVFALTFSEQLLLALPASAVGLAVGALLGGVGGRAVANAALLLVLYLAGAAISTVFIANTNVIKLTKTEDE